LADEVDRIEPHDFAAALVEKAGGWEELNPSMLESEEVADAEDSDGPARGADGRFVARVEEEEFEEDVDAEGVDSGDGDDSADEEAPGEDDGVDAEAIEELEDYILEIDDPAVEAYLEKYGGDIGQALKGAANQTDLVGRQGLEVGELRNKLDQLTQFLLTERQNQAPVSQGPSIDSLIDEQGPAAAAQAAYERGDPDGLGRAVSAWKDEDEYGAAVFVSGLQAEFAKAEMLEMFQAQQAQGQQQQSDGAAVAEVVKRHPDIKEHLPAMAKVASELPMLQEALKHGSAEVKAQTFETLYRLAASQRVADTSSEALRKVAVKTQREVKEAKAQAAVVSASRRKSAGEEPTRVDEFKSLFREATGLPQEDE
jgi:hypothetical protein